MENDNNDLNQDPNQNNASATDDLESIKAQLAEEQQAKAALETVAAEKDAKIATLEGQLQAATTEISTFNTDLEAAKLELATVKEARDAAVGKYLGMAKVLNPTIPEHVIRGATIAEIDASIEEGKSIVESVRKIIESEASKTKVPAGAPGRAGPNLEGMSAREKISYGIQQKGGS